MACLCAHKLKDLLASLLPLMRLQLPALQLPPVVAQLGALSSGGTGALALSADLRAQLSAIARLSLPPFPLSMTALANLQASATAVAQLQALGITPGTTGASAQLAAVVSGLNANLLGIPAGQLNLPFSRLAPLSATATAIANIQARFGVNLLAPNAAVQLKAALAAAVPITLPVEFTALSAAQRANLSAYATLAATLAPLGGINAALPMLRAVASLRVTPPRLAIPGLSALLATLLSLKAITAGFGISPLAVGASAQIAARLQPLQALATLTVPVNLTAGVATIAGAAPMLAALSASAGLNVQALAGMNLRPLLGLPLPNIEPINLAMTVASEGNLQCTTGC